MKTLQQFIHDRQLRRAARKERELQLRASELYQLQEYDGDIWLTFNGALICPEFLLIGNPVTVLQDIRRLYIDRQKKSLNLPSHTVLSGSAAENKKNTSISHESQ